MPPAVTQRIKSALKGASHLVDRVRPPQSGITILIYHRVGLGAGGEMDLDAALFSDQMQWLAENRRVISLDSALDELAETSPAEPGVVVTFDDGTIDWLDVVAPVLETHEVPATFYVATRFVDERLEFPHGGRPISWGALTELAASPLVTVGSHTHSHALLDRLAESDIDDELDRCSDLLAEHLGDRPQHFCYPKALPPAPAADAAVRSRFRSAVLAGTKANVAGADPFTLSRSPIQASDATRWFRAKVDGGLGSEDDIRRALNRVRYRGADV